MIMCCLNSSHNVKRRLNMFLSKSWRNQSLSCTAATSLKTNLDHTASAENDKELASCCQCLCCQQNEEAGVKNCLKM